MKKLIIVISLISVDIIHAQKPDFGLVSNKIPKRYDTLAVANAYRVDPNFGLLSPGGSLDKVRQAPHPRDAIVWALADCQKLDPDSRLYQRYIWIPDGKKEKIAAVNFAINTAISRSTTIIYPTKVADGKLLRYDLRQLSPRNLTSLYENWEKLAFEPYFHIIKSINAAVPLDAVQIDSNINDPAGSRRYMVGNTLWYQSPSQELYELVGQNWIKKVIESDRLVAAPAAHTDLTSAVLLEGLTQSAAAVVRFDFLVSKILSTADGGLYYDFSGINEIIAAARAKGSEKTDQQLIIEALGADGKMIADLRSDQRSAMFRSNVTGKPRQIEIFQGQGVRPGSGTGFISITHDPFDNDVDPQRDPIRNLLNFNDRARELIAERGGSFGANGLHLFALFGERGNLQNEAPANVVVDHTIPRPHTGRLQAAISCIRCHGPQEGWQPFKNEVQLMLTGYLDIYGDESSNMAVPDQLDRLAGLYTGSMDKPIRRARDDYTDAVFKATSGMQVPEVSLIIANIYQEYVYDTIDARKACLELGYIVPSQQAADYMNQVIPPMNANVMGISQEDPIIGALKAGLVINRSQWEQVYPDAAFRATRSFESFREKIRK